jgi:hypothetical protein
MSTPLKILIAIWLVMITRFVGTLLAARHCLRLRKKTSHKMVYELLTGFGVGLFLYAVSDFFLTLNGIVGLPPAISSQFPTSYIIWSFIFQFIQWLGVWIITLVIMNGGAPGKLRESIFWVLKKLKVMESRS